MNRTVYLENWAACIGPTIDELQLAAGQPACNWREKVIMLREVEALQAMIRHVKQVDPDRRPCVDSPLVACSVREPLNVPESLIARVGEIHDIYRRFRTRLEWPTEALSVK